MFSHSQAVLTRDIPHLDRKVAQDTFTFYNHLLAAERGRDLIFEIQRQGTCGNSLLRSGPGNRYSQLMSPRK